VDDIVAQYTQTEQEEEEEETIVQNPIEHSEAFNALHILRKYEEQSQSNNHELLRILRSYERSILSRQSQSRQQGSLDSWLLASRGQE
jgi:hypothetical protein